MGAFKQIKFVKSCLKIGFEWANSGQKLTITDGIKIKNNSNYSMEFL